MAADLQRAQEELAEREFEGSAGGGAVHAVVSGDQHVKTVTIDPEIFEGEPDSDDIEMLADTVTAAVNDALAKARDAQQQVLGPLSGGLGGMGLPGA